VDEDSERDHGGSSRGGGMGGSIDLGRAGPGRCAGDGMVLVYGPCLEGGEKEAEPKTISARIRLLNALGKRAKTPSSAGW
jgi:hypothetical protein